MADVEDATASPALPPPKQQKEMAPAEGSAAAKMPLSPESPSEPNDKSDDNQQQEPPKEDEDDSNNNNDDDEQAPSQPPWLSISVPVDTAEESAVAAPLSPVRSLISKFADAPGSGSRSPSQRSESVAKLELTQPSPVKNIVNRFEVKPDQSLDALKFRTVRDFFPEERSIHVGAEKEKYDALTEQQKREAEAEEEIKTARPGNSPARSTKSSTESPGDGQGKLKSIASRFENQQKESLENLKVRTVRDFFATGEEPTVRVSAEKQKFEAEKDKSLDNLKVRTVRDFFATGEEPTVRVSAEKQKFEALEKQQLEAKEKAAKKPGGDSATSTPVKAPSVAASAEQSPANTDAESADEATTPSKAPVKRLASRFEMKFSKKPLDALPFRTVRNFFSSSETPSVRVGAEKEKFEAQKKTEAAKDKSLDDLKFRTVRDFFPTGEEPTVRVGAEKQKFEALEKKQVQEAKDKETQRKGVRAGQSPTKSQTTSAAKTADAVEVAVVVTATMESTGETVTTTHEVEVTKQDAEVVVQSTFDPTSAMETGTSELVTEVSEQASVIATEPAIESAMVTETSTAEVTELAAEAVTKASAKETQSSDKHEEAIVSESIGTVEATESITETAEIATATTTTIEKSDFSEVTTTVETIVIAVALDSPALEVNGNAEIVDESAKTVVIASEPISVNDVKVEVEEESIGQTREAIVESIQEPSIAQSMNVVEDAKVEAVQTVTSDATETSDVTQTVTVEPSTASQAVVTTEVNRVDVAGESAIVEDFAKSSENVDAVVSDNVSESIVDVKTEVDDFKDEAQTHIVSESVEIPAVVSEEPVADENVAENDDGMKMETTPSDIIEEIKGALEVQEVVVENSEVVTVASSVEEIAIETMQIAATEPATESIENIETESNTEAVVSESEQLEIHEVIAVETPALATEIQVIEESTQSTDAHEQVIANKSVVNHVDVVSTEVVDAAATVIDSESAMKVTDSVVEMMESLLPENISQVALISSESADLGERDILDSTSQSLSAESVDVSDKTVVAIAVEVTGSQEPAAIKSAESVDVDAEVTIVHEDVIDETVDSKHSEDTDITEESSEQAVVEHKLFETADEQSEVTAEEIAIDTTSTDQTLVSEGVETSDQTPAADSIEAVAGEVEVDTKSNNATFKSDAADGSTKVAVEESSAILTTTVSTIASITDKVDAANSGEGDLVSKNVALETSEEFSKITSSEEKIISEEIATETSNSEEFAALDSERLGEKSEFNAQALHGAEVLEALESEVAVDTFEHEAPAEVDVVETTEEVAQEIESAETEFTTDDTTTVQVITSVTSDRQVLSNERSFIVEDDSVETEDTVVVRAPISTDTELLSDDTPPSTSTSIIAIEITASSEILIESVSPIVDAEESSTAKSTDAVETSTVEMKKTRTGSLSMRPTPSRASRASVSKSRTSSFSRTSAVTKSPARKPTDHSKPTVSTSTTTKKSSPDAAHGKKPATTKSSPSASSKSPVSDSSTTTTEVVHRERKSSIMTPTASSVAKKSSGSSPGATASTPVAKKPAAKKPVAAVSSPSNKRESTIESKRSSITAPTASSSAKNSNDNTGSSTKTPTTVDTSALVATRTITTPKVTRSHPSSVAAEQTAGTKRTVTNRETSKSFDVRDRLDASDRRKSIATPTKPASKTDATAHRRLSLTSRSSLRSTRTRHGAEKNTISDGDDALKPGDACSNESQASSSEPSDPLSNSTGRPHKAKLDGVVPRYMDYQNDPNFAKHAQMQYERRKRLEEINALKSAERQHALRHFFAERQMQVYQQNVEEIRRGEQQHEYVESNREKQRELDRSIRKEKAQAREEARAARKENSGSSSVPRPSSAPPPHARGFCTPKSVESKRTTSTTTTTTISAGGEEVVATTVIESSATNSSSDNQGSHSEDELTSEKELSGGITSDDDASFTVVSESEMVTSSSTQQLFESEVTTVTSEKQEQQDVEPATPSPEVE